MFDLGEVDLESLIAAVDRSGLTEVTITTADGELRLSKATTTAPARGIAPSPASPADAGAPTDAGVPTGDVGATASAPEPAAPAPAPGCVHVRTPLLGVFYRASEPGAAPFVEVGDHVEPDQTVAIIEAMKVFTAVPAGVRGVVREVLVGDRDFVEFDQPVLVVETDDGVGTVTG